MNSIQKPVDVIEIDYDKNLNLVKNSQKEKNSKQVLKNSEKNMN